jgi:hypothetical protein
VKITPVPQKKKKRVAEKNCLDLYLVWIGCHNLGQVYILNKDFTMLCPSRLKTLEIGMKKIEIEVNLYIICTE